MLVSKGAYPLIFGGGDHGCGAIRRRPVCGREGGIHFSRYVGRGVRRLFLGVSIRDLASQSVSLTHAGPDRSALRIMQSLYDSGQIFQAYRLGVQSGDIRSWRGQHARILGGRIAMNLGAPRLGRALHVQAFRENRNDPETTYYYARALAERRGPLAAIDFQTKTGDLAGADDDIRSDWLALRGGLAASYRDFELAGDLLSEAERLAPQRPWICVERGRVLEAQDRYEEAVHAVQRSFELQPDFRSGYHQLAHLLQVLDRDDEALELLKAANERIESAALLEQLASLQDHLQQHAAALETLARIDELCPMGEKQFSRRIAWLRSDIAYHAGDCRAAISFAEQTKDEFMLKVAAKLREHLDSDPSAARVLLRLPFVRQHHMTCAPATLSSISRFWGRPADHLSLVEEICYDGTPSYSQRHWAQTNHWLAREFTITWEAAVNLVDRGVPFTMATAQVTSAHLQAVIGYDRMRGTLLCRDPYAYYIVEFSAELLLKQNAATGPRGMIMLPEAEAGRLDGLQLPDSELFDLLHELEGCLARHDRAGADAARSRLISLAPDHRLTHHASRALGAYDGDVSSAMHAIDSLLRLYPEDQPLLLARAYHLRRLDRRDLLLPLLQKVCESSRTDPAFLLLFAEELRQEQGDNAQVIALLRRALRRRPTDAAGLTSMANALWSQRKLEQATALYYMAACVDDKNEGAAKTYFIASRHLRQTERALSMLGRRFARLGKRSCQPGCTLFWAMEELDRVPEALALLEDARAQRPDDGDLLLFAAEVYGRRADLPKARATLEAAATKTRRNDWLRSAARLEIYQGRLADALKLWKQVIEAEPLAADAHNELARLIAQTESPAAAAAYLLEMEGRFPHNLNLGQLRIVWLRSQGAAAVIPAARQFVERWPGNVRGRVEMALHLTTAGEAAEALAHAEAALAISPFAPEALNAAGGALRRLGQTEKARAAFRRAIEVSVDFAPAIHNLLACCTASEEQRQALTFVHDEIVRQVIFGDGLMTYRELASSLLEPAFLLSSLRDAHAARPDLWQTWSALVLQLCDFDQLDEALLIAKQAAEAFPLLPRVWLDLSHVHGLRANRLEEIESLRRCLQLSPGWSWAAQRLARALKHADEAAEARSVLERAVAHDPLAPENHSMLARLLWAAGEKSDAVERMRRAVSLDLGLDDGWQALKSWASQMKGEAELERFTRDLCRQRPGEAIGWIVLARMLDGPGSLEERIACCDAALSLSPRNTAAHDLKVCLLHEGGRFDEALAACQPIEFAAHLPVVLRGRRAWLYAAKGEHDRAIELMKEVLEEDRSYYWGWSQLLSWLEDREAPEEYLDHAARAVELFPHDVVTRNHLAAAQLATKDRDGAKLTLRRAIDISPSNTFALHKLFTTHLQGCEYPQAESILELIERHTRRDYFLSRVVLLAAAQRDASRAAEAIEKLCLDADVAEHYLNDSVSAMDNAGLRNDADRVLESACSGRKDINPLVVQACEQRLAGGGNWRRARHILSLFNEEACQWRAAATVYVNQLATNTKNRRRLNSFVRRHSQPLRSNTPLWGAVGYALFNQDQARRCIRWLSDWESRSDSEPWMLLNLAGALHRRGHDREAVKVHQRALSLKPDFARLKHVVWLAFEEALSGKPGDSMRELVESDTQKLDKHYPYLCRLIAALTPLCSLTTGYDAATSRTSRQQVSAAARGARNWSIQPEIRRSMRRSVRRLLACRPSWSNRLWAWRWMIACSNIRVS